MGNFVDMTGQKIGKLTIIELDHMHSKNGAYWKCLCDCGSNKISIISRRNIVSGHVLSCGCLVKEAAIKRRDNLLGVKFGFLTVFDFEINERHNLVWLCKCDCGSDKIVCSVGTALKNGKTKSCGCIRRKRLPFGDNAFNRTYYGYKDRAEKRGFDFDFTKEEFKIITKQNCYYCGIEPLQQTPPTLKGFGYYTYNGVDRIDNTKGYTKENSVPCCGICNIAKNNHSQEDFLNWIKRAYKNLYGEK